MVSGRHLHTGQPIVDDDATIAAALEEVSVPVLMCSMVHLTGDPGWIRGDIQPVGVYLNEYQGFMSEEMKALARQRALGAIIEFRDSGAMIPPTPPRAILHEMMSYLVLAQVPEQIVQMFLEDLELVESPSSSATWADALSAETRAVLSSGRDRLWRSWSAGWYPTWRGRNPVHNHREERRAGRYMVGEPLSRSAGRRGEPLLLLLVRAGGSLDGVLRAAARTAPVLHERDGQIWSRSALSVQLRGHLGHMGRISRAAGGWSFATLTAPSALFPPGL